MFMWMYIKYMDKNIFYIILENKAVYTLIKYGTNHITNYIHTYKILLQNKTDIYILIFKKKGTKNENQL